MKLTAQDYNNTIIILEDYGNNSKFFALDSYCLSKIEELEKPVLKQYRCIKNTFPFDKWFIGEMRYESGLSEIQYKEHPFHFEEVIAPVEKSALTVEEIYNELIKIENEGNYCSYKFLALIEEIKITHKL